MIRLLPMLLVVVAFAAYGCTPAETEATSNSTTSTAAETDMTTATDEGMAFCDGCGAEVPHDKLTDHDGNSLCEQCISMHADADEVACTGCGTMMAAEDATMKDGEPFCAACAAS